MAFLGIVDVPRADTILEVHMPPLALGRAKMHWTQLFWRITISPSFVSSCDLTFESTELLRARLGPRMVRNSTPWNLHHFTYLGSNT